MKSNIETMLTGLIPALSGPLPPELIDLAVSLVSRSQRVATSLKPDEEIARPYACCELACERLKKQLNLPAITSRPPCPPRIYKKLYAYLNSSLSQSTRSAPQTPKKTTTKASLSTQNTPKTPLSARKTPRSTRRLDGNVYEPPDWVMPTIRALCKEFSYPSAAPHIYVGVATTLPLQASLREVAETPSRKRPRGASATTAPSPAPVSDLRILSLIAVLLFYAVSRLLDQDISPEQVLQWRAKAVATLRGSEVGKEFSEADMLAAIDVLMPKVQQESWLEMEWYSNIQPSLDQDAVEDVEMEDADTAQVGKPEKGSGALKDGLTSEYIGLGTMMQDATDFLSAGRRQEYKSWKADILARVREVEST